MVSVSSQHGTPQSVIEPSEPHPKVVTSVHGNRTGQSRRPEEREGLSDTGCACSASPVQRKALRPQIRGLSSSKEPKSRAVGLLELWQGILCGQLVLSDPNLRGGPAEIRNKQDSSHTGENEEAGYAGYECESQTNLKSPGHPVASDPDS